MGSDELDRSLSHFALVNVSRPDLDRFPLARFMRTAEVDVEEGCALLLPAFWYHRVESYAPPGRLNVAVNCWFNAETVAGEPSRLHRVLREKLRVDCHAGVARARRTPYGE